MHVSVLYAVYMQKVVLDPSARIFLAVAFGSAREILASSIELPSLGKF